MNKLIDEQVEMATEFHFVFPETGQPSHVHNRLLDAPFATPEEASAAFVKHFADDWTDISKHEFAFLNSRTGEIVAIRKVSE